MMKVRLGRLLPMLSLALLLAALSGAPAFAEAQREDSAASSQEETLRPVQVFDVAAGKVVKTIPNDKKFQKMAKKWTGSITGLAPQLTADQSCTYVYRVPLAKPVTIQTGGISLAASDLFLFYCKEQPPMLLTFDDQRKPYLFLFDADIKPFIKKVGLPPLES
ncbi:hypothetical protein [Paenibacillus soyae]|uniref:Uncharacterized protein n=1 Tax=Paenibacillus soyae TaxID=2969249 RepID=A0A9X2S8Z7_9BACL|nr:hypothetical protein [Paenibacillus soyae]MCR2802958.1 hypothetical protein [Paenibacillus soyae]